MLNTKGQSLALGLEPGGQLVFWRTPDADAEVFAFDARLRDSKPHHVALSYTEKTLTLWLDGTITGTIDIALAASPIQQFAFGGFAPGSNYFGGRLGRLRIWSGRGDCVAIRDLARSLTSQNLLIPSTTPSSSRRIERQATRFWSSRSCRRHRRKPALGISTEPNRSRLRGRTSWIRP